MRPPLARRLRSRGLGKSEVFVIAQVSDYRLAGLLSLNLVTSWPG
jgi:hypothetical protein